MKIPFSVYDVFGYLAAGFVLLVSIDFSCGAGWLSRESIPPVYAVFWTLVAFVAGHLVAHMASVLLENLFLRRFLRSPDVHLFEVADKTWRSRLFPGNFQPLPVATQERVRERAAEYGAPISGRGLFLHCHAIVKHQPTTLDRLNTFLAQYGFCRNISMAFALAALVLTLGSVWCSSTLVDLLPSLPLTLILAVGMLYPRHYTIEVFTSYAIAVERSRRKMSLRGTMSPMAGG